MRFSEFVSRNPFFIFSFFGAVALIAEGIFEISSYGSYNSIPLLYSSLPHYFMAVAAVYDIAISIFPILMTLRPQHAVRWGYLTAMLGGAGQYINTGPMTGILFIAMIMDGLAIALLSARRHGSSGDVARAP